AVLLAAVSAFVLRQLRRRPYLATGWFWYLGTLVPVIGLVQVGDQAMADRYTYLPLIGILIVAAWGGAELVRNGRAAAFAAAAAVIACGVVTWFQVGYWKGSIPLFEHTLRVTGNNYLAHACLGLALTEAGRSEAIPHYREALKVNPYYSQAEASLGL